MGFALPPKKTTFSRHVGAVRSSLDQQRLDRATYLTSQPLVNPGIQVFPAPFIVLLHLNVSTRLGIEISGRPGRLAVDSVETSYD